ncbi:anaerobic sulfite reductase subunit B [bacterium BMS3Bbin11]|nr:anaerobic sulfite reductase subunit B [bacterium BMS3Abin11]GBE46108.1 anaerobic sulfite reductase subunit B [bacterium BMS3Bbin11]HDH08304.1 Ni/Fe hydrogenase subunit gamma [Gammaproteobacteria bacterium]HDH14873.1 Ni/Fe hydrogenase subunit gamma [Gammaproteobacteria bacterium]HDZ79182.1 Ni/Fe hydrogenase subunit gamma [Gammaproteobacteria bacterium]
MTNPYLPMTAEIIEYIQESPNMYTLRLQFTDPAIQLAYNFEPGQFNMLYLYAVGEIPISIVSDPKDDDIIDHTIRAVGRVSNAMSSLNVGDVIGVRGPYGRGWPVLEAEQHDVVIVTGGLGCAPVVSAINYIANRRERFGKLNIVQGVKHSSDLIWRKRYDHWRELPDTRVLLAADDGDPIWPFHIGRVTDLFEQMVFDREQAIVMLCGPEAMMRVVVNYILEQGVAENKIWLSMERNMQCGIGHCGHCQYGSKFVCRDGPVFNYEELKPLFGKRGF